MDPIQELLRCWQTFHYSILFILGLIFSYTLVEKTFHDILITHLTHGWEVYDLPNYVIVVNLLEGISAGFVPFFAWVADVLTGRVWMVVYSTIGNIIGLGLGLGLNSWAGNDDNGQLDLWSFWPALVIMASAQAAQKGTLQAFLYDQIKRRRGVVVDVVDDGLDENVDERQRHTKYWWTLVTIAATIFSLVGPLRGLHFSELAIKLIYIMLGSFVVFFAGTIIKCYRLVRAIENPFTYVQIIDCEALPITINPRWHSVVNVRPMKLRALWVCLLILGLVSASGSTLFFLEASRLVGHNHLITILTLAGVVTLIELVVSVISNYLVEEYREREREKVELLRIGIGMFCCVLCCIFAGAAATHRKCDTGDTMSVCWLIPQLFLLGVMGGLAKDGFQSLYEYEVSGRLWRYGQLFGECSRGVGSFMSAFFIFFFSSRWSPFKWFGSDLGNSSLHDYYALLAGLSLFNLMIYLLVAFWYIGSSFPRKDEGAGVNIQPPALEDEGAGINIQPPALEDEGAGVNNQPPALEDERAGDNIQPPALVDDLQPSGLVDKESDDNNELAGDGGFSAETLDPDTLAAVQELRQRRGQDTGEIITQEEIDAALRFTNQDSDHEKAE